MRALLLFVLLLALPVNASTVVPPELLWCDSPNTVVEVRIALLEGSIERKIRTLNASSLTAGTREIQFAKTDRALRLTGIRLTCEYEGPNGPQSISVTQKWKTHYETSNIGDVIRLKMVFGSKSIVIPSE